MNESLARLILSTQEVASSVQSLIHRAYEAGLIEGRERGAEEMRDAILRAAQSPVAGSSSQTKAPTEPAGGPGSRAPRGAVRLAVFAALNRLPGLTEMEVGIEAAKEDASVSRRSVGAELRRMRDRLYRNEGGRWFLIPKTGEMETAGESAPAVPLNQTEEAHMEPP